VELIKPKIRKLYSEKKKKTEIKEEDIKQARSARRIQNRWKGNKIIRNLKLVNLIAFKKELDETHRDELMSKDLFESKIGKSVKETEKKIKPFEKNPDAKYYPNIIEKRCYTIEGWIYLQRKLEH